jgi:hypothetical protein
MALKTLIQEAMDKNALGFETALKEELRARVSLALEAKMKEAEHEEDDEEDEPEEESDDAVKG